MFSSYSSINYLFFENRFMVFCTIQNSSTFDKKFILTEVFITTVFLLN